jgi:hypothetical protein
MERRTIKATYYLSDSIKSGEAIKAAEASTKIISDLAEVIIKGDLEITASIKKLLDVETMSLEVTNYPNYILGRVHAIVELMNFLELFNKNNNK